VKGKKSFRPRPINTVPCKVATGDSCYKGGGGRLKGGGGGESPSISPRRRRQRNSLDCRDPSKGEKKKEKREERGRVARFGHLPLSPCLAPNSFLRGEKKRKKKKKKERRAPPKPPHIAHTTEFTPYQQGKKKGEKKEEKGGEERGEEKTPRL